MLLRSDKTNYDKREDRLFSIIVTLILCFLLYGVVHSGIFFELYSVIPIALCNMYVLSYDAAHAFATSPTAKDAADLIRKGLEAKHEIGFITQYIILILSVVCLMLWDAYTRSRSKVQKLELQLKDHDGDRRIIRGSAVVTNNILN
jgi:hypothetical protein